MSPDESTTQALRRLGYHRVDHERGREVFDLLRPRSSWRVKHKTNEKNRWQLGKKVVLTGWVERTFSKRYVLTREQQATALETATCTLSSSAWIWLHS